MRLVDHVEQLALVEVRVGDDQLVDLVRLENRTQRVGTPEHGQRHVGLGSGHDAHEVVVDPAAP